MGRDVLDQACTGYPSGVIDHRSRKSRSAARRAVLAISVALFGLLLAPVAAFADTPAAWENEKHVSGLQFLVVLVLIPAGLFVVISLLAALPSMISDKGYEPGQSWRSEAEWFGGPRKGLEAADEVTPQQIESAEADRGGTSGQW
jgi:hypothetical protein